MGRDSVSKRERSPAEDAEDAEGGRGERGKKREGETMVMVAFPASQRPTSMECGSPLPLWGAWMVGVD